MIYIVTVAYLHSAMCIDNMGTCLKRCISRAGDANYASFLMVLTIVDAYGISIV